VTARARLVQFSLRKAVPKPGSGQDIRKRTKQIRAEVLNVTVKASKGFAFGGVNF
jgi:hypothetical protein